MIDRNNANSLIPTVESREIIQGAVTRSAVMALGTRLPNMTTKQQSMPVLTNLPVAYFVNGDTGLKRTSQMAWDKKFLVAEEIAVIIPIPEAVLDDADYDIWGEVRPRVQEAFGYTFDRAVLFGYDKPGSWPAAIVPGAVAAGTVVTAGTGTDIYDDVMGESGVLAAVEQNGYMVRGHIAAMTMKARLRGLRDTAGRPIFSSSMQQGNRYELDGEVVEFPENGVVDDEDTLMISGDWRQLVRSL